MSAVPVYLITHARWLLWRTETRIDRKTGEQRTTKVPISFHTGKPCDVTAPASWTDYDKVKAALARTSGAWDGAGFALGLIESIGEAVIGLDLDTCLGPDGDLAEWAQAFLAAVRSYVEVSPGGVGIKGIARIRVADLPEARLLLDIVEDDREQARTRVFGERVAGQHAPSAQLFLMARYFTVTGRHWVHSPEDVTLLSLEQIAELAALFGPKERRANGAHREAGVEDDDTAPDEAALRDKLQAAFVRNPRLKERWQGGTQGLNDTTRSGRDMSVLAMLVTEGFTRGETYAALCWFDHGKVKDEPPRYFGEMWRRTKAAPRQGSRPVIEVQGGALPYMVAEAEVALLAAGVPIYQRAFLVRPTEQQFDAADGRKTHSALLVAVTAPYLLKLLAKVALWQKYDGRKKKLVACNPPNDVVNILLASRGDWTFPAIRGVVTCPTLRPDGSLLTASGYDRRTRYFLSLPADLALPPIPDRPSREEAEAALARLDKLLDGFPFEDEASRSVALAILMTPVLRVAMDMSPLLGVSAKSPGTGKSFLVDLATTIALGRFCPVMGPGKDDKETEKRIDTNLISGMPVFSIDNVHRPLDLVTLNTATERPVLTIRLFGTLTNVEVENSVTIFMTGNNLAIVGEQGRRTVRVCMDAKEEQPEQRDFPLGNPIEAVLKDRGSYIAGILTIARAYHVSGSPRPGGLNPFGSYPGWSRFVREPLVWLGRPDPVASQEAARADDPATIKLLAVIDAWYGAFGMGAMTLTKAVQYATTPPGFVNNEDMTEAENRAAYGTHKEHQEALLAALREAFGKGSAPIDTHALGNWMRAFDGRIADGLRFEKAKDERGKVQHDHGAVLWKLTQPDQKGPRGDG